MFRISIFILKIYFTHQKPDGGDGVSFLKGGLLNQFLQLAV